MTHADMPILNMQDDFKFEDCVQCLAAYDIIPGSRKICFLQLPQSYRHWVPISSRGREGPCQIQTWAFLENEEIYGN